MVNLYSFKKKYNNLSYFISNVSLNKNILWYWRYNLDDAGSACHAHISLWQNGKNVFMASDESSKYGISTLGKEFMAGILYHLSSILSFITPLPIRLEIRA